MDLEFFENNFNILFNGIGLKNFVKESNNIEGIYSDRANEAHLQALTTLLEFPKITLGKLEKFVSKIEPKAHLRTDEDHMVMIGGHIAPKPKEMLPQLKQLLKMVNNREIHPYPAHCQYEYLHPFMDGNGRSGRALWCWQMVNQQNWRFGISFLHKFYYQSLDFNHKKMKE